MNFRNGWEVRLLDFGQLDAMYELRILLEQASVRRMKDLDCIELNDVLVPIEARWRVRAADRSSDAREVAKLD